MDVGILLNRLSNVRRVSDCSWRAKCPNSCTRNDSLVVTLKGDDEGGLILLHCFACGDTPGILAQLGLKSSDLCPKPRRQQANTPEGRRKAQQLMQRDGWAAALQLLVEESTIVTAAAAVLKSGQALTAHDATRLQVAALRIMDARDVLAPHKHKRFKPPKGYNPPITRVA